MYPEEVYQCGLPLPYELLRPIVFQVAYEQIKEKLRFPTLTCASRQSYALKIISPTDENLKSVYMYWGSFNELYFEVNHIDYRPPPGHGQVSMDRGFERKYQYFTTSGKSQFFINGHPDELLKFISHI